MISLAGVDLSGISVGDLPVSVASLGDLELWSAGLRAISSISEVKAAVGVVGSASSVSYPIDTTGGQAGDMYLVLVGTDGNRDLVSTSSGWVRIANYTTDPSFAVFVGYHGTAADTLDVAFGASESYALGQWHFRGTTDDPTEIDFSTITTGSSSTPNLPAYTAAIGELPYLWFQAIGVQGRPATAVGEGWTGATWAQGAGTAYGAIVGAHRIEKAATIDPPAATLSASASWAGLLLAIPPRLSGFPAAPFAPAGIEKDANLLTVSSAVSQRITGMVPQPSTPDSRVFNDMLVVPFEGSAVVRAQVSVTGPGSGFNAYWPIVELWRNDTLLETLDAGQVSYSLSPTYTFVGRVMNLEAGDRLWLAVRRGNATNYRVQAGASTFVEVRAVPKSIYANEFNTDIASGWGSEWKPQSTTYPGLVAQGRAAALPSTSTTKAATWQRLLGVQSATDDMAVRFRLTTPPSGQTYLASCEMIAALRCTDDDSTNNSVWAVFFNGTAQIFTMINGSQQARGSAGAYTAGVDLEFRAVDRTFSVVRVDTNEIITSWTDTSNATMKGAAYRSAKAALTVITSSGARSSHVFDRFEVLEL